MAKTKRLIAVILAVIITVSALPITLLAMYAPEGGMAPNSLLPLEERSGYVTINRIDYTTEELIAQPENSIYVYEALKDVLRNYGELSDADEQYDGVIMWSFDNNNYVQAAWDDIITLRSSSDNLWFILNNGDQLNPDGIKYIVGVKVNDFKSAFMSLTDVDVYNDAGESVYVPSLYRSWTSSVSGRYYNYNCYVSDMSFGEDEIPSVLLKLPEGYSAENVTIYSGMYYSMDEIEQIGAEDITTLILDDGEGSLPYKIDKLDNPYGNYYNKPITVAIAIGENGKIVIPANVLISSSRTNNISFTFSDSNNNDYTDTYLYDEMGYRSSYTYSSVYNYGSNLENVRSTLSAYYYDYFDPNATGRNLDKITCAFIGNYSSLEEAVEDNAEDIKEQLFSYSGYTADFLAGDDGVAYTADGRLVNTKTLQFTVFDVYENIYDLSYSIGVLTELDVDLTFYGEGSYSYENLLGKANGSYNLLGELPVYEYGTSFEDVQTNLSAKYYDTAYQNDKGSHDLDIISSAYLGNFSSAEEAQSAGAADIKESLFTIEGMKVDFSIGEDSTAYIANSGSLVWMNGSTLNWIDVGASSYLVSMYVNGSVLTSWNVGKTNSINVSTMIPDQYRNSTVLFVVYTYGGTSRMIGSAAYYPGSSGSDFDDSGFEKVNLKTVYVTVVDIYGVVYNMNYSAGIMAEPEEDSEETKYPSNATYFDVYGVNSEPKSESNRYPDRYSCWTLPYNFDSYYRNGYQTVFILDGDDPVEAEYIYPLFHSYYDARVYIGKDAVDESEGKTPLQKSGESGIKFESGAPIQYSAASESGTHLKNYWVTFITPQKGPKLFVNGTNYEGHYNEDTGNPVREIFFNSKYGYSHDIMIANIGDEPLTNLKVTLSDDAQGVVLDDYWKILEEGVRTLGAFDSTYDGSGDYLDNIAKIRLKPADDYFGAISGTLTISADGNDPVVVELTGIAGVPKITTTELFDGVMYVPYSCVIQTNSMYEADALSFSVTSRELPQGMELKSNGELYGVPKEDGYFEFVVTAVFSSSDTYKFEKDTTYTISAPFKLTIKGNTDKNVDAVNYDDQGYELLDRVSREVTVVYSGVNGDNTPIIDEVIVESDLFRSEGAYDEYLYFYLDGEPLKEGVDFISEEGSTKITILDQTFGYIDMDKGNIPHTLAAEFRTGEDELRHSAQNIYIKYQKKQTSNPSNPTNPSYPTYPNPDYNSTYYNTVTCVMKLVDANGNPVSGLFLELHSTPQYTVTGSDGSALFLGVEFGRHTLYATDAYGKILAQKTFSIVSGDNGSMSGDIISAQIGEIVEITVLYDGGNLMLLDAETVVEIPEEGTTGDEDPEESDIEGTDASNEIHDGGSNPKTGIVFAFPTVISALLVATIAKKKQF